MGFLSSLFKGSRGILSGLRKGAKNILSKFNFNNKSKSYNREESLPYAQMSNEAYKSPQQRKSISSFVYQPNHSNTHVATFLDANKNLVVVAFRGTEDLKSDLLPDLHIAMGKQHQSPRFIRDLRFFEKIKSLYRGFKFHVTGHSLGGGIANFIADKHSDVEGKTFNAGRGLDMKYFKRLISGKRNKLENYRTGGDIVSLLNTPSSITVKSNKLEQHGIDNFL